MRISLAVAMIVAYALGSLLAASAVGDLEGRALPRLAAIVSSQSSSAVSPR